MNPVSELNIMNCENEKKSTEIADYQKWAQMMPLFENIFERLP